jgi:hypothetical protein
MFQLKTITMKKFILLITTMVISIITVAQDVEIYSYQGIVEWNLQNPPPCLKNKKIILHDGAILRVTDLTLEMSSNKAIELKENSQLIIDNTTITLDLTTGNMWTGIRFAHGGLGFPDKPGFVRIQNNSSIEFAETVFRYKTHVGGGVLATNSRFMQNGRVMEMVNHTYTSGHNFCRFVDCDFYNTSCHGTEHEYFLFNNVNNVNFLGCTFRNGCPGVRRAIKATNSGIIIGESNQRRSLFSGFPGDASGQEYAIDITNQTSNQTKKVKITNCDFQSSSFENILYETNQNAIRLKGCANPEVYSNTIALRSDGTNDKYGIFLDGCTGFVVEDNEITATGQSGTPIYTYGIVVVNSGEQTNMLYRNRLDNLAWGIQARGRNRGPGSSVYPAQGLKFFCNEFNSFNTAYYMAAVDCNDPDPSFGVSKWQQGAIIGAYGSPCFNSLATRQLPSNSIFDFRNDHYTPGTWDIQYMLPSGPLGSYAINYYSTSIFPDEDPNTTIQDPHCESRLPCIGINCPVLAFPLTIDGYFQSHSTLRMQLSGLVNNGDHSHLLSLVEGVNPENLSTVYEALMTSVPSHDILTIVCANELFSAAMIRNILVENSYGIKSWSIREALEQRDDQLTTRMMEDIFDAASGMSEYEELMYEIDYMNQEYLYVMNRSIDALISRDSIPMDSVKMYLDSIGDMISHIRLIHIAFEEDDIAGAGDYYDSFEMIAGDMAELEYYGMLYEYVLLDIYTNHAGDFSQMEATQVDLLYNLMGTNTYAAEIAKFLLNAYGGYEWTPGHCDTSQNPPRKGQAWETNSSDRPELLIYPNPATNLLNVVISGMEVTNADVEIMDISGKLIAKERISAEIGQIDVSLLKPGFYILRMNVKGTVLSKPLIISK